MNFSIEEIFSQFGQYDQFVSLSFHYESEAHQRFGYTLMGVFQYTLEERRELIKRLNLDEIPRSDGYIKFNPSGIEDIANDLTIQLDKQGILCSDIALIQFFNGDKKENRFGLQGSREIPDTIEIKVNTSEYDSDSQNLWDYNFRLKAGYDLTPTEKIEYYGMLLFYYPKKAEELKTRLLDINTEYVEFPADFYFKKVKYVQQMASKEDKDDLRAYIKTRNAKRIEVLKAELAKSHEQIKEVAKLYETSFKNLVFEVMTFEHELILPYKFPIWWDYERFVHIYCRHVVETKVGERFENRTVFRYKLEDVRRIADVVIKSVYEDIVEHFKSHSTNFRRMGDRSIYYDGVYYRVEIENTGRLLTFHPYNDDNSICTKPNNA